jgi:hypothetical protein
MQKFQTDKAQRAVFFGMINPLPKQSSGQQGFASSYRKTNYDLSFYTGLKVRAQVQGTYNQLRMVLMDNFGELKLESGKAPPVTYEAARDV